ncbi:MAG: phosphoribosylamine--glycine ligase N-terminal domain-containing protein, partial [Nitrososphaerales archaeon]
MVDILLVGSGGREAALEWKLQQSKQVGEVFTAPGNAGSANSLPYNTDDFQGLVDFAQRNNAFTVVGPEAPLS